MLVVRARTRDDRKAVDRLLQCVAAEWRKRHGLPPRSGYAISDVASTASGLVAVSNGRMAGTVSYRIRNGSLYVFDLAVGRQHRRQGVARALVGRLCDIARSAHARRVTAHTLKEPGGFDVFRRLDFEVVHETPEFVCGGGPAVDWTSVYMVRRLSGTAPQTRRTPRT